jgi:hypothetical protein
VRPGDRVRLRPEKVGALEYFAPVLGATGVVHSPCRGWPGFPAWWVAFDGVPSRRANGLWDCYEHTLDLVHDAEDPT